MTQIGRYEAKGVKPAGDILAKIATALSVSSDFLISGISNEMTDASLSDKKLLQQFKKAEHLTKKKVYTQRIGGGIPP